ncbi:MAG: DeoR/GlpR transcriptional regulator [Faecalicoccus sp.]|nr:DeoR/GlpR transcriptional regulator [Faecalicoccus sp.]
MNNRQARIIELLEEEKRIEVTRLSQLLKVSQVTIRKDLDVLETNGIVKREHGYAALNDSDDINLRLAYKFETKQKIAKAAADLVQDGQTVMIESGSSCALLAQELATTKKDITIITNSAFIAGYIRKISNVSIILLGGQYQNESQVMVGPMVAQCARNFFVDILFAGTDGYVSGNGFTGNDFMRAQAVRDMARQAREVVLVTDSSKFTKTGVVALVDLHQISKIITDQGIPENIKEEMEQNQIQLITI